MNFGNYCMSKYNSLLFHTSAADYWEAALPLGNGRIGAMIHGGSRQEKICLNEDTLWSGLPDQKYRENAPANLICCDWLNGCALEIY